MAAGRTTATRPFGRQQRLVLYLGVFLGLVAAVLVFVAVNSAGSGGGADKQATVVAARDIPANTRVTADMLEVQLLPTDKVDPEAFTARSQVVDRVITQDVKAGEHIGPAVVSDQAGEGLAFRVEPGHRAVSISVQEVVITGGNARPGDHVDIVAVFEVGGPDSVRSILSTFGGSAAANVPACNTTTTFAEDTNTTELCVYNVTGTLFQDMRLIGLAQTVTDQNAAVEGTTETPASGTEPSAASATLEVTPQQAQLLSLADQYGALRLTVRPFGEEEQVRTPWHVTLIDKTLDVR
ncbi:MAG: Flp pilus assembly protein CpaB [Chloroflexi bacterium]|nr:Flp pilus assembly protein CpaB [Chloroflexota bacterium]